MSAVGAVPAAAAGQPTAGLDGIEAVAFDQGEIPFRADAAGRDLCLHVANDKARNTNIVAQDLPDLFVLAPFFVNLDRLELQALGIGVDGVDNANAARAQRADVEVVCGRH